VSGWVTNLTAREALGVIVVCFYWVRDIWTLEGLVGLVDLIILQIWSKWTPSLASKCGEYLRRVTGVKLGSWSRNPLVNAVTNVDNSSEKSTVSENVTRA
jgi:hypothetical protein